MYNKPAFSTILASLILIPVATAAFYPLALTFIPQLCGLIGCFLIWRKNASFPPLQPTLLLSIALICTLALLSSVWSISSGDSLERALKISALLVFSLPFVILSRALPQESVAIVMRYIPIPIIISAMFMVMELGTNLTIVRVFADANSEPSTWWLNKHVATLMMLLPLSVFYAVFQGHHRTAYALSITFLAMTAFSVNQASQLAFAVMVLAVLFYYIAPKLLPILSVGMAVIAIAAMPFLTAPAYDLIASQVGEEGLMRRANASQRLEIWDFVSKRIMENPWTGFGIDSTRYMTFDSPMIYHKENIIMHPHNIALQIWIEFGALGVILAIFMLGAILVWIRRYEGNRQLALIAVFSATFCILLVSWSIWSGWLLGLIMLLTGLCQLVPKQSVQS